MGTYAVQGRSLPFETCQCIMVVLPDDGTDRRSCRAEVESQALPVHCRESMLQLRDTERLSGRMRGRGHGHCPELQYQERVHGCP